MLQGPVIGPSSKARKPRTSSSTYVNERLCEPSPKIVIGWFCNACTRKLDTARPSSGRINSP
jgi:hypothetical protein